MNKHNLGVHHFFEQQARSTPERSAIFFQEQRLSFDQLNRRANILANHILTDNVSPGGLIAVIVTPSIDFVVSILAVLKAGCAFLPIDPTTPKKRIHLILQDAKPDLLITTNSSKKGNFDYSNLLDLETVDLLSSQACSESPQISFDPKQVAYVIYTSGSSGTPKGVLIQHNSLTNQVFWMISKFSISDKDRVLQRTSCNFDAFIWELFVPLISGGQLYVASQYIRNDLDLLIRTVEESGISIIQMAPSLLSALLDNLEQGQWKNIRILFSGGEILTRKLSRLHNQLLDAKLVNLYGPTEATINATFFEVNEILPKTSIPIGKCVSNMDAILLDESLNTVPENVKGQIYLKGIGLAKGYLHSGNNDHFIRHPEFGRIYATGDYALRNPDGNLEYKGRVDNQIKLNGQRFELEEIERVLCNHPQIKNAACLFINDSARPQLFAFLVANKDRVKVSGSYLDDHLPQAVHPTKTLFVDLLPVTSNGKLDRSKLFNYIPKKVNVSNNGNVKLLDPGFKEIFENLSLEPEDMNSSLLHQGGHSLIAMQLKAKIKRKFGCQISFESIMTLPLIELQELAIKNATQGTAVDILKTIPGELYPLSHQQQAVWFEVQMDNTGSAYHETIKLKLSRDWDFELIQDCLNELIDSHETLRTVITTEKGEVMQKIVPQVETVLHSFFINELSETEANKLEQDFETVPFDYEKGPLIRFALFDDKTKSKYLFIVMHHLISDDVTIRLLLNTLAHLHQSKITNQVDPSPLAIDSSNQLASYKDYVYKQINTMESEHFESEVGFWSDYLKNAQFGLKLPATTLAREDYDGDTINFEIDSILSNKLQQMCKQYHTTPFMVFIAAFKVLLFRYTSQSDISVLTPVSDRYQHDIDSVAGFFVNTIIFRSNLTGDLSFSEYLKLISANTLSLLDHRSVPLNSVINGLDVLANRQSIPRIMFVMQNMSWLDSEEILRSFTFEDHAPRTSKLDLTLFVNQRLNKFSCGIEYRTNLFTKSIINRMIVHFRNLLEAVVENSSQSLSSLSMLDSQEQNLVTTNWNQKAYDYPSLCIHQIFEKQVKIAPEAEAITYYNQSKSYEELNAMANQLAHVLAGYNIGLESLVGISINKSVEMVSTLLGIMKAGGAYVAIDPDYPQDRINYMVKDSGLGVIITQREHVEKYIGCNVELIVLEDLELDNFSTENPMIPVEPNNLAYLIYTSGTTGSPKGVLVEHKGVPSIISESIDLLGLDSSDVVLQFMSLSFDASLWEISLAVCSGASLCVLDKTDMIPSQKFTELLNTHHVSMATLPPSILNYLVPEQVPYLNSIVVTGESCSLNLVKRWSGGRNFYNGYGPSETTIGATIGRLRPEQETVNIGRPFGNYQIYILDEFLNPVPILIAGEIFIGGIGVSRGYHNISNNAESKFIDSPFDSKQKLFKSGDIGRFDENGNIEFLGRNDRMVNIRGIRIELEEIENALLSLDGTKEAVVQTQTNASGVERIVAFMILEVNRQVDPISIRSLLADLIPAHMVPEVIIPVTEFHRNHNGKIDYNSLPFPDPSEAVLSGVQPNNQLEKEILDRIKECLDNNKIGITDNLFEAGGNSLLLMKLVNKLTEFFGIKISIRSVFDNPTASLLAAYLENLDRSKV